jgi:hypothetical protein
VTEFIVARRGLRALTNVNGKPVENAGGMARDVGGRNIVATIAIACLQVVEKRR